MTATDHGNVGQQLKPLQWAKNPPQDISVVTLPDNSLSEAMAALNYGWDATDAVFVKLPVDHSTGVLKVSATITSGGSATPPATATLSNVNDTNVSTTLLSLNASRLGVVIVNDSTVDLYVKFGTTASLTSFTYHLYPGQTFADSAGYTGRIDGIWASDASGAARITELTA